ncbi:hypothetical protein KSP40_PGU001622 [Platanthera guangdongensis]|uniref:Uncharacterized protein n=1 Tax=Platanthera guangdongensis TaxID=2320717 RepID=A0ABR2MM22_9ASPA
MAAQSGRPRGRSIRAVRAAGLRAGACKQNRAQTCAWPDYARERTTRLLESTCTVRRARAHARARSRAMRKLGCTCAALRLHNSVHAPKGDIISRILSAESSGVSTRYHFPLLLELPSSASPRSFLRAPDYVPESNPNTCFLSDFRQVLFFSSSSPTSAPDSVLELKHNACFHFEQPVSLPSPLASAPDYVPESNPNTCFPSGKLFFLVFFQSPLF